MWYFKRWHMMPWRERIFWLWAWPLVWFVCTFEPQVDWVYGKWMRLRYGKMPMRELQIEEKTCQRKNAAKW